jgi:hypothetical protein
VKARQIIPVSSPLGTEDGEEYFFVLFAHFEKITKMQVKGYFEVKKPLSMDKLLRS